MAEPVEFLYPEKWLSTASAGERVTSELRLRIISGKIENGTILSENKLAADFSMSRSPIREALKVLASENMIRLERMGAVVIGLSEKEINEIHEVQLLIGNYVFEQLAKMDTNGLVHELNKTLELMKISIKYQDSDDFSFHNVLFHEQIICAIHHSYIELIWNKLKPVIDCLTLLSSRECFKEQYYDFEQILKNYELLIKAIWAKDKALLKKSMLQIPSDLLIMNKPVKK
jgi:GntR family transcriptional regulator of gluconate operon